MTERQFQAQVVSLARLLGWKTYHTYDSRRSNRGWPDLALVRDRLIMAELKTEEGRVSPYQRDWIDALGRAGVESYIWRPSDFEFIEKTLTRRESQGRGSD